MVAGKNGDLGLVWMMVQVNPLVKNKICDIIFIIKIKIKFKQIHYFMRDLIQLLNRQ